jgi:regulator of sigma E protease
MGDGLSALFWGVITFSLLVVVHEGGHFLAARAFGVKVHEFMVGLPGPAIRFHGPKTTYGVTAVPLGGYVRIAGMEPGPEDPLLAPALAAVTTGEAWDAASLANVLRVDEETADRLLVTLLDWDAVFLDQDGVTHRSRFQGSDATSQKELLARARSVTYRALTPLKRIIVLSMGVILNLATAVLVFTVVLSLFGYAEQTGRIGQVGEGTAAQVAGIVAGDRVIDVSGTAIESFDDLVADIARRSPGDRVNITVERGGERLVLNAVLGENPETGGARLGVSPEYRDVFPGPWGAFLMSFSYIGMTFAAILGFFNPATFAESVSQSSSVIGAAVYAAEAAEAGPLSYAGIIAALSLSLGVINILPLPPLDGGKIAIEIVEWLRGRPLPRSFSIGVSLSGAVLLFALIAYLMFVDISRIVGG